MVRPIHAVALALCLLVMPALPCLAADATGTVQKASAVAPAGVKAAAAVKAPVNINTASAKDLTKLEGIGEKTAKAIVDYRTKNGPFKAPEDLMKVKGIGEKKYAALKSLITVQ